MGKPSDYDTVAAAIRFVRGNFRTQPSLEEVARHVSLSPFQLQKLFTWWAGVSPKRFLQYLTAEHAKQSLRDSAPVLQAALDAGLSGPARLHDLLVSVEAVTPGEYKGIGGPLQIRYDVQDTPFGLALLGVTPRGLCHLSFLEPEDARAEGALKQLNTDWPTAQLVRASGPLKGLADTIFLPFSQQASPASLSVLLKGTNFQIRVWSALLRIPPGRVTSYGRLAEGIGLRGSARAVGSAVARNPIAFLIPCHRVIRETGRSGQYRWGSDRKEAILGWEAARFSSTSAPSSSDALAVEPTPY